MCVLWQGGGPLVMMDRWESEGDGQEVAGGSMTKNAVIGIKSEQYSPPGRP